MLARGLGCAALRQTMASQQRIITLTTPRSFAATGVPCTSGKPPDLSHINKESTMPIRFVAKVIKRVPRGVDSPGSMSGVLATCAGKLMWAFGILNHFGNKPDRQGINEILGLSAMPGGTHRAVI